MIDRLDQSACGDTRGPADEWRHRLDDAENGAGAECFGDFGIVECGNKLHVMGCRTAKRRMCMQSNHATSIASQ
jgi:hypothetical protein